MKIRRVILPVICIIFAACSFDYGNTKPDSSKPDIVMRDVEYVRVRGGDPLVRFQAEYAERFEEKKIMNLESFSFEQFENHGTEINAIGKAGEASVELDSGNIKLSGTVRIAVESEDITIETATLQWKDKEKQLSGPPDDTVDIYRSDGTSFTGTGFSANARERTWIFTSGAEGSYVDDNDDNDDIDDKEDVEDTEEENEDEVPENNLENDIEEEADQL